MTNLEEIKPDKLVQIGGSKSRKHKRRSSRMGGGGGGALAILMALGAQDGGHKSRKHKSRKGKSRKGKRKSRKGKRRSARMRGGTEVTTCKSAVTAAAKAAGLARDANRSPPGTPYTYAEQMANITAGTNAGYPICNKTGGRKSRRRNRKSRKGKGKSHKGKRRGNRIMLGGTAPLPQPPPFALPGPPSCESAVRAAAAGASTTYSPYYNTRTQEGENDGNPICDMIGGALDPSIPEEPFTPDDEFIFSKPQQPSAQQKETISRRKPRRRR